MGNCLKYWKAILYGQRYVSNIRQVSTAGGHREGEMLEQRLLAEEEINICNICELPTPPKSTDGEDDRPAASPSSTKFPRTLQDCISLFDAVKDESNIDDLIRMIKELLQRKKSKQQNQPHNCNTNCQEIQETEEKNSAWTSFTKSGSKFLTFLDEQISDKDDLDEGTKVAMEIFQQLGKSLWVVGRLSMIAYLLSKIEKLSGNRTECLELLGYMIDLAEHENKLNNIMPEEEEKFTNATELIFRGSIICASQLDSKNLFRFMKISVNSEALSNLRRKINELYPGLLSTAVTETMKPMEERASRRFIHPITKPVYPDKAGYYTDEDTREH